MPSEKILESKKAMVAQLKERLEGAQAGVLADYRGLSVAQDTELRNKLREAGVEYTVLKNSIINFAIRETELESLNSVLEGPTALATSKDDVVSPAKVLVDFAKENEALEIKGGFVEGKVISIDEVKSTRLYLQKRFSSRRCSVRCSRLSALLLVPCRLS